MRHLLSAAAIALSLVAAPARADDLHNDDWSFNFMNDSSMTVVTLSMINTNGKWSNNWLKTALRPGTGLTLQFYNRSDTRCEIRTYVQFADQSYIDEVLDYCDTAVLTVNDSGIYTQ